MGRHETRHMGDGGEIVIPKDMRDHLGIGPGDEVTFEQREDGAVVILPLQGEASERSGSSSRSRSSSSSRSRSSGRSGRSSSLRSTGGHRHAERTDDCF